MINYINQSQVIVTATGMAVANLGKQTSRGSKAISFQFTSTNSFKFLMLCVFIVSNISGFAQNGDVINEGIFKIKSETVVSSNSNFTNEATGDLNNDGELILRSNLINDGTTGFSDDLEGNTRFEGTNDQLITGITEINLKNVLFANSATGIRFLLENDLNVYGIANFTQGIVDNTDYFGNFNFYNSADHINTSDNSYVNGPVNKIGNTDFTFPIGKDGYYRMGKVGGIFDPQSSYEATYFLENSNNIYPHDQKSDEIEIVSETEYWTLNRKSNNEEDILISLSWNDNTTEDIVFDNTQVSLIAIVRWDEETSMWVNEGGVADEEMKTVTTSVNKDGFFTLGRIINVETPCDVIAYSAVTPNGDGRNDYFQVDIPGGDCGNDLNVTIFNRWGVKVFEADNYGSNGDFFDGISSGRLTLNRDSQLPSGTYYYILDYQLGANTTDRQKKAGYLYLSGN